MKIYKRIWKRNCKKIAMNRFCNRKNKELSSYDIFLAGFNMGWEFLKTKMEIKGEPLKKKENKNE